MFRTCAATVAALGLSLAAHAAPVTMTFSASDFVNVGVQYAGLGGPIHGSITWDRERPDDPVGTILDIDLVINGHTYELDEIGIAHEGSTQTAIGGLVRGANTVVGDGQVHDFLMVFDRVQPSIQAFAYSVEGRTGALWWAPAHAQAAFTTGTVPTPPAALLVATALGALALRRRRTIDAQA